MSLVFNKRRDLWKRRKLRRSQTEAEALLWEKLRARRLDGLKFRRQYGVDRYVLDFYCPGLRLAIEVDGPIHDSKKAKEYDRQRQAFVESLGISFLRFRNEDVFDNMNKVLKQISKQTFPSP